MNLKINKSSDELLIAWVISMPDAKADELLVDKVSHDMRIKLLRKRKEGMSDWFGTQCTNDGLKKRMIKHIEKGDMIDVINFAGMIHCRTALFGDSA